MATSKETLQQALDNALNSSLLKDAHVFLSALRQSSEVIDHETLTAALLSACSRGNMLLVQSLLTLNIDVNCEDDMGNTPLMICAMKGFCDIARLLLNNGASIKSRNNNGDTPLTLCAISSGSSEMIKLLFVQEGIDIYEKNSQESTVLMKAVEIMDLDAIIFICSRWNNVDCHIRDGEKFKEMLHEAQIFAERNGVKVFAYIKQCMVEYKSALVAAASECDFESVKLLIQLGFLEKEFERLPHDVVSEIVMSYIKRNTGIKKKDIKIFKEIVRSMTKEQITIFRPIDLLGKAVSIGNCELLDFLCEMINQNFPNVNQTFYEMGAFEALYQSRFEMLNILLKHKGDFWLKCEISEKIDFLNLAFQMGAIDFIKLFFCHNERERFRGNILSDSVKYGQEECFDLALETFYSDFISALKHEDCRMLHDAVENGNIYIVTKLLQLGANVNGIYDHKTPLMFCTDAETANILIQNGADINFR